MEAAPGLGAEGARCGGGAGARCGGGTGALLGGRPFGLVGGGTAKEGMEGGATAGCCCDAAPNDGIDMTDDVAPEGRDSSSLSDPLSLLLLLKKNIF